MDIDDLIHAHQNGQMPQLARKLDVHPGWLYATIFVLRRMGYNIPTKRHLNGKKRAVGSRIWWQQRGF